MNSIISALLFGGGNGGGGGGSNLPSYPSDNGIYKLIYDGENGDLDWQGNDFNITASYDVDHFVVDKTFTEIREAYSAGQRIILTSYFDETTFFYALLNYYLEDIGFYFIIIDDSTRLLYQIYIKYDNTVTVNTFSLVPATRISISDTGVVSQTLLEGYTYLFVNSGITDLTITIPDGAGHYHFSFGSGDPAVNFTWGSGSAQVYMPDGFAIQANKHYEIDIVDQWGTYQEWSTS